MPAKEKEETKKKKRVRAVVEEVPSVETETKQEEKPLETIASVQEEPISLETLPQNETPNVNIDSIDEIDPVVPNAEGKNRQKINLKAFFVLTILIALVVGFISGGVYVYVSGMSALSTPEPTAIPTATPEPTPEPTPEAQIDFKSFSVAIYNGSGKIGEAGKVEALLENDFSIDEVANADKFDYEETVVSIKSNVSDQVIEKIIDLLSADYEVVEGDVLNSSSDFDIEITVGSLTPES